MSDWRFNIKAEVDRYFDDSSLPGSDTPKAVILIGGVCSGKTTLRRQDYSTGYVVIDAAQVFHDLSRGDSSLAFPDDRLEPLDQVGSSLARRAIGERRNLVTELLGAEKEPTVELLEALKSAGYEVEGVHLTCSAEEATERNAARGDNVSCYYAEPFHRRWIVEACRITPIERILEVGAEGGSYTLLGRRSGDQWEFALAVVDQTLSYFDPDESEIRYTEEWIAGWPAALRRLNRRDWHRLHPVFVNPAFEERVMEALQQRIAEEPDRDDVLRRWQSAIERSRDSVRSVEAETERGENVPAPEYDNRPLEDAGILLDADDESMDANIMFQAVKESLLSHLKSLCLWPEEERNKSWRVGDYSFYILSFEPRKDVEIYVQLWSEPDEDGPIFEVVSGALHEPTAKYVSASRQKMLRERGFAIEGNARNFRKLVTIQRPADLNELASEMVAVLCDVMGYKGKNALSYRLVLGTPYTLDHVLGDISPDSLQKLLIEWGFPSEVIREDNGSVVLVKALTDHGPFLVLFEDETKGRYRRLRLVARCDSGENDPDSYASNLATSLPRAIATVNEEGDVRLVMPITLEGGVTAWHLRKQLESWANDMAAARPDSAKSVPIKITP